MMRILVGAMLLAAGGVLAAWGLGLVNLDSALDGVAAAARSGPDATAEKAKAEAAPPAVTVVSPFPRQIEARVLVTGTLVARTEVLVAPEVDGLRVVALDADIGDRIEAGQVLARLERETLEVQLAQRDASIARARAAMAQSKSTIAQAQARMEEADNAFDRGQALRKSGYLSESTLDQRQANARSSEAALVAARDGLALAEAEIVQAEAQRRDIVWRLAKTHIRAPTAGIVSQRNARVGGMASGALEPMFRIIAGGEIELEAEVPETDVGRLAAGQKAIVDAAGAPRVHGVVRLVSPEVDRATRLGRVRIALGDSPQLRVGSFARGSVVTARSNGLVVPAGAVQFGPDGARVQIVDADRIVTRSVTTGLVAGAWIEVVSGVTAQDHLVAKAGTFLRHGDRIRPIPAPAGASGGE